MKIRSIGLLALALVLAVVAGACGKKDVDHSGQRTSDESRGFRHGHYSKRKHYDCAAYLEAT